MATQCSLKMEMTITDTLASTNLSSSQNALKWSGKNINKTLNASSTPAVTKNAVADLALSSGALTVNLAAVVRDIGDTVDFTGRKIQGVKLRNKSTNANDMTITQGAANGYDMLGATFEFTLKPAQAIMVDFANASPTVGSSDRTFDVAGTGAQVLEIELVG